MIGGQGDAAAMDPFAVQEATWPPAEVVDLGPWRAAFTPGAGRRVSSARATASDAATLLAALPQVEAFYAARGDALIQLRDDADPQIAAALAARGYAPEAASLVLLADAAALAARPLRIETRPYLIAIHGPLAALDALWAEGEIGPARRAVMTRTRERGGIWGARVDHRLRGAVFIAQHGAAAGLHALHVAPDARRRGVGGDLVVACARWATARGAETVMIAVEADNAPARALYARLGAVETAGYRYFRRPAPRE